MISVIKFEHGEKTCSPKSGVACMWNGLRKFGTVIGCALFGVDLYTDGGHLLQRCPSCINRFGVTDEDLRQECQAES